MQNYKKTSLIFQLIMFALFCAFVIFWESYTLKKHSVEIQTQACVIAIDLWNIDANGPQVYLEMAARLNNYELISVYTTNNKLFAQAQGPKCGIFEGYLVKVKLIPRIKLESEIKHNDIIIGKIIATHRHTTIYLYLYILLIMGLIVLVSKFFIRTIQARDTLDKRVKERTAELYSANQQLKAEEKRYREIFNAPSDAIVIHDAKSSRVIDVNKGMLEMYGYDYMQALNLDLDDLSSGIYPYNLEEAGNKINLVIAEGPQTFDWHSKRSDGSLFWVEISLKLTTINDETFLLAVVRDVNERKRAEQNLAAEKEQLAVTLRSIGDGVITTDLHGNVVLLNGVAEKLTGWSQTEAVGRPLAEIFIIVNEQSRALCENPVSKVINSGQIVGLANHTALIAKDGSERSIADSGAPIRDKDSQVIGVVLVFRDVTEQIKNEQELLKAKKLESIGVLAGGIAHDFNNILAAILGNISLALTNEKLDHNTKNLLTEAEKAAVRAKDLTQQLLTFSKGGAPVKETSSLANVIKESAGFVIRGDKVNCQYQIPPDLWLVDIDKGQISQVIQNIVINASHAMPQGGTIQISCENIPVLQEKLAIKNSGGKYVKITIKDCGSGISTELIDKIFDPYFTTKQQGNGLGLAICQSIIKKHNGFISVKSPTDNGTSFSIFLPASTETKTVSTAAEKECQTSLTASILLMDDDDMVQRVVQAMLSKIGHEVVTANDGEEALELYRKSLNSGKHYDLLIMDLTIPGGMGGQEATQEILKLNPKAKVIVSSGYSNDPIMANFRDFGFCAAIVKPIQLQELSNVIKQTLEG